MKKYKKQIFIIFIILAALVSICFIPINASKLIPKIEEQIAKDLGLDVHIEKLTLRLGPSIKLKTPLMHVLYQDGRKFAQFNGIKLYIGYLSLFKNNPSIKNVVAKKAIIKLKSNDEQFNNLTSKYNEKSFRDLPDISLKSYSITFQNSINNENYYLNGQDLELTKLNNFKNYKLKSKGNFNVNNKKYLSYDLSIIPQFEIPENIKQFNAEELINQMVEMDFHSDIIADLKIYKVQNDIFQASGFVNIDNISVLDPTQKNSKSFIYLTFWGDKAGILSNIYTSQDKKVYVEGMVNNSKKPILDIKVKTDEIQIEDLYKKIKVITNISGLKNIKTVNGTLNANFMLKGDLNKLKSNGFMKISNAKITMDGLNIDKINSEIDFNNNAINIINAIGYANNSPILLKGKIDKSVDLELLMSKVDMKYLCPLSSGVKNGALSLAAKFFGTLNNLSHKENLLIENLEILKNDNEIKLDSIQLDTNKNNTAYITNLNLKNNYTEPVKIPSLKLIFEEGNIKIPNTDIYMANSKLTAFSNITNYTSEPSFNTVIKGFINSKDIKKFSNTSANYPININITGNKYLQNVNSQVFFEKPIIFDEPVLLNLSTRTDKKSIKIDDLSLFSFTGKLSDDLKQNLKGAKKIVLTGLVENLSEPILKNVRLFIPQQLNLHFADTIMQTKGDLFINGKYNQPEIIGQMSINNLFNQQLQMSLNNTILDFSKNTINIDAPAVKLADTAFSFNGNLSTDISQKIELKNINIKSKYLNTDTILMYKDFPTLKILPLVISDGKIYSERISANIYSSPLYMTAFSANFSMKKDVLQLKNIIAEMFNGKLAGSLDYNLKDEQFNSNLMGRNVSAAPIFDIISHRKDTISGVMDFDTSLKGELTSKNSLNGDIKFIVNNGRMSTLGKLEHLLYAQNVIADNMLRTSLSVVTKAITLKDTGLFKYLRGDVKLENGIANINLLQSQGPLMALFIKGQYQPQTDYAKLTVLGRLSDEIISGLGAFGDFSLNKLMIMLTGENNSYNILPEDFDKIPQLPMKNTKEFRSVINGIIDKPSSVLLFNWISYSQKSLIQKEVPMDKVSIPSFINDLQY